MGWCWPGAAAVDEAMVTGEGIPVAKQPGAEVIGGTVNGSGALEIRAAKVGADTLLARIVQMVAEAQRSRAPIQRVADAVSAVFVPAVIAVAVVTFGAWLGVRSQSCRRPAQRGGGVDHRLPVRPRPGHPDVDHGRHRARRRSRRAVQGCRRQRTAQHRGHPGGGQDRHPHRGAATGAAGVGRSARRRKRGAAGGRRGGAAQRAPAVRGDRGRGPAARLPGAGGGGVHLVYRSGSRRHGGRPRDAARQPGVPGRPRGGRGRGARRSRGEVARIGSHRGAGGGRGEHGRRHRRRRRVEADHPGRHRAAPRRRHRPW